MLKKGNICLKHIYLHYTIQYVQSIHTKICVFAQYASIYALNVPVKILAILTEVVISLTFSKISPEASPKTAKPTRFDIKQMEDGQILWTAKTSSTFGAK